MSSATPPSTYDVFLSHGSPDKPWVRTLRQLLTAAGVTAYLDEVAIEVGDSFVCNLSRGIGRTSTFMIVVSKGTTERPWVEHEWTAFMATHGPRNRIIPVLLDDVALPAFLRPYQAIHAVDRNAEAVAARIIRAVGKPRPPGLGERYTGQSLNFTVASINGSDDLAVTAADGVRRTVTPPWRQGNAFGIALHDFEVLTREMARSDAERKRLGDAAQTVGAGLFDLLVSDDGLRATFERATAAGPRGLLTLRSDEDWLLSLPWELLFHDQRFLVRDNRLDVVRSATTQIPFEALLAPPSEPFTLVTNVSAPEGSALSHEEESFRIAHALTGHCADTPTELGTLADLIATVQRAKPRGIHFSGHGAPGVLGFENDEGFEDPVPIERVVDELRRSGDGGLPPFFFLASCHGNTPAEPAQGASGSSSSAAQLHRAGVTQVVGYYGPIADELATRAAAELYAAIAGGEPTRQAVTQARAALLRGFDGDGRHRPAAEPSPTRDKGAEPNATHPFAWAQLVFYHRGPEHALGTAASEEQLRRREGALKRTYRQWDERAFLDTGFIGRRRELHELRRRRRQGKRVFVLQGLGGLGKTTLAGQFLPTLAASQHTVALWCRRTEDEPDQAEALVGQLLRYARDRFGAGFEQVVSAVDRQAGDDSVQRFAVFLQVLLEQQQGAPLAVYLDNLESLLHGPGDVSLDTATNPDAFGSWRSPELRGIWQALTHLANAVGHLYVVASCRYHHADFAAALVPVAPLGDADLLRLMAWFGELRRLSARTRARLVGRLVGHPRAVEVLDDLMGAALREWEETHGEWRTPAWGDVAAAEREWEQLVVPALPQVDERIWSDLLLAALWERVLDARARRMLFRMTLLRRPWQDDLTDHLGEPEDGAEVARRTARALARTSLLQRIDIPVRTRMDLEPRPHFTVHVSTAAFVRSRFGQAGDLALESHQRIGTYLEEQARTSRDFNVDLEAGHHLFEAGEYDRAYELLASASELLRGWGRVREGLQILLPFLADGVQRRMSRDRVGRLLGRIGLAYADLGETRRAIKHYEQQLVIAREIGDRRGESNALGNLGNAYADLGETRRAIEHYEQAFIISREIGDRRSEGQDLGNLGNAYAALGEALRATEYHEQALVISREIGDRRGEGTALGNLGNAYAALGQPRRAIEHYEQQLVITREIGDRGGEGNALGNLGNAYAALGEPRRAIERYEQVLVITREIGDRRGEGASLGNLGLAYAALGETRRAITHYEQVLVITREIGDRRGEGNALGSLGVAYADLGETHHAIEHYEQQLVITREIGDRRGEGNALGNLGNAYAALGESRRAIEHYEQQLVITREIGARRGEGANLGNLGNACVALGETRRAIEHYEQALVISREIGDRRGEGANLGNLGNAYAALGETRRAIEHYEQSLAIGRALSDPRIIEACERGLELLLGEGKDLSTVGNVYATLGETRHTIEQSEQHVVLQPSSAKQIPLHLIFRTDGPPQITFVAPVQFEELKRELSVLGRGLIVEGPSKVGKTTAVRKVLAQQSPRLVERWFDGKLLSTQDQVENEVAEFKAILDRMVAGEFSGHVLIDDAHYVDDVLKRRLAMRMKSLADMDHPLAKVTILGINPVGSSLPQLVPDLAGRFHIVRMHRQPNIKIEELILRGEQESKVLFRRRAEITDEADGSFYAAQSLCYYLASQVSPWPPATVVEIDKGPQDVMDSVCESLRAQYHDQLRDLAANDTAPPPPRGAGLALLWLLSKSTSGDVPVQEAINRYPTLIAAFDWLLAGHLQRFFDDHTRARALFYYNRTAGVLSIEDPQLRFYLRRLDWAELAAASGHVNVQVDPIHGLLFAPTPRDTVSDGTSVEAATSSRIDAVHSLAAAEKAALVLHLSDLHIATADQARNWHSQLTIDLREQGCDRIEALVVSGDVATLSTPEEYDAARLFLEGIMIAFSVTPKQLVMVPGNHDLSWAISQRAYTFYRRKHYSGVLSEGTYITHGDDVVEVRNDAEYNLRFQNFAEFYRQMKGEEYPLDPAKQATLHELPEHDLLFLGLNSAWIIDHHFRARADINPNAVSSALLAIGKPHSLRIAVWHHPVNGSSDDRIGDTGFLQRLAVAGFRVAMHGHLHKSESQLYRYDLSPGGRRLDLIGGGTFGAPIREWVPGYPLQYNLLRITRKRVTVETRRRDEINGAWGPDARWSRGSGSDPAPRYRIDL